MFYNVLTEKHGLAHDPFKAIVAPRPIGWISSLDENGIPNLAPYSFFNGVSDNPHIVMFSSAGIKDSLHNIEQTGDFTCNIATYDLRNQMNVSSANVEPGVSEFELAGLTKKNSRLVKSWGVDESPITLECQYLKSVELEDIKGAASPYRMVLGQVVGIHISESVVTDGKIDMAKLKPIARLGYRDYAVVDDVFEMVRPSVPGVV
ncbi:MAG: flavin reductase family protein [Stappiaceae bacterium]